MTTKQIINLDYRIEENKEIIQKVLKQIKPLFKYSVEGQEIEISSIEKVIYIMCKKYEMRVNSLTPDIQANNTCIIWRATIISDKNLTIIDCIYGISIYEVLAKTAIRLYHEVKGGIQIRD